MGCPGEALVRPSVLVIDSSVGIVSSSMIVAVPEPSRMVALTGDESTTANVSFGSYAKSPNTVTFTGCDSVPGVNVSTPELAA